MKKVADEVIQRSKSNEYYKEELQGLGRAMTKAGAKKANVALKNVFAFCIETGPNLRELKPKM
ncbi:hypothetical protein PIB30_066990, partial [Stylosanthes scabra]|nr:hypothetical protein [Stylosanthes scabra]